MLLPFSLNKIAQQKKRCDIVLIHKIIKYAKKLTHTYYVDANTTTYFQRNKLTGPGRRLLLPRQSGGRWCPNNNGMRSKRQRGSRGHGKSRRFEFFFFVHCSFSLIILLIETYMIIDCFATRCRVWFKRILTG